MFTTGSKFFFGATALSLVGAIVFAVGHGGPTGVMGTVGMLTAATVFCFLGGINYFNRDGNVSGMDQGAQHTAAAARAPAGRSAWPMVASVGLAGLVVGSVSKPVVFQVSLVVLLAAGAEWMVQGWSERASADPTYNATLRKRILNPLEFPILGALVGAAVVYAFSRILLTIDKEMTPLVFIIIGALIAFGGFVFASKRGVSKRTLVGVCSIAAVALLGAGVASAVQGQRTIEEHPTTETDPEVCLEAGVDDHIDEHAAQDVSAKSSVIANVYSQSDGTLQAFLSGVPNIVYNEITVPRSATVGIIFHNETDEPQRLTARLGTFGADPEVIRCTTAVNSGKQAYLSLKVTRTNEASSTPLVLHIAGNEDQVIQIVVP